MNKIEQMVKEMCPEGVKSKKWGDCVQVITAPKKLKTTDYLEVGQYPVIDQGQKFIVGYSNDVSAVISGGPYCLFGDHTREIKYVDFDFIQGADGLKILKTKNGILSRYFLHCMRFSDIPNRGYNRHWSIAKEIEIPLPPLPIQEAIVEILDKFESLQQGLQDELQARKKQYEYFRNKLLTQFPDSVQVKEFTLGEIAIYSKERIDCTLLNPNNYVSVENLLQNKQGKVDSSCVPTTGNWIKFSPKDILIGNIRPYLQKIWLADCNGGTNGDVLCIRIADKYRNDIIPEFLYYVLSSNDFFDYDTSHSGGGKMPRGDKKAVLKYPIIIPSKQEQQGIVSILDHFETLVNDQEEGIPAEIAAVKKQYEYYRNKLLTF